MQWGFESLPVSLDTQSNPINKTFKWFQLTVSRIENGGKHVRTALITGVSGQDGSYLADLLLEKNYTKVLGSSATNDSILCS